MSDLDDLFVEPEQKPNPVRPPREWEDFAVKYANKSINKVPPAKPHCKRCWGLVVLCIIFAFFAVRGCDVGPFPPIPIPVPPGPDPIVVDQPSILVLLDGDNNLTPEQAAVANSEKVKTYCDENGIDIRVFQVTNPDVSRMEPQWKSMLDAANKGNPPNMVIVGSNNKGRVLSLESVDKTLELLKELK